MVFMAEESLSAKWANSVLESFGAPILGQTSREMLLDAFGGRFTGAQVLVVKAVVAAETAAAQESLGRVRALCTDPMDHWTAEFSTGSCILDEEVPECVSVQELLKALGDDHD